MFVRTDDYTIINLDRYDQVLALPGGYTCDDWMVWVGMSLDANDCDRMLLFGPCKELGAKVFIDLLNSALLRGDKCMDVRA